MTLFGLDTPWPLFAEDNKTTRARAQEKFVKGLNAWLAEPLEDCLAVAGDGSLCIEGKSPVDIDEALGLYHGNIFQTAPTFPFAEERKSRHLGRRDGIQERVSVRLKRATGRRRQRHPRSQRREEGGLEEVKT